MTVAVACGTKLAISTIRYYATCSAASAAVAFAFCLFPVSSSH